jgi:Cu+-exporting ATPase
MESNCVLKDPVCGMAVTVKSFHHLERQGQSYFFCGTKCKTRFANQADRYSGQSATQATPQEAAPPRWTPGRLLASGLLLMALVSLGLWLL